MYVNLNWIDAQKTSKGKCEASCMVGGSPTPPAKPQDLLNGVPLFMEICGLWMWFNINKIFASDAWAEMSLNEVK